MAVTVTSALIGSLIFSLTLVPLLCYFLLRKRLSERESFVIRACKRLYRPSLNWALEHRRMVIAVSVVMLAAILFTATRLGSEFLPELNEGTMWVNINFPPGISVSETRRLTARVREILRTHEFVRSVTSKAGRPEDGTDPKPINMIEVDRAKAARYGLKVADIQDVIETALGGKQATEIWEGEKKFAVVVRLPEEQRQMDNIKAILVDTPDGQRVPLDQLAVISIKSGSMNISREMGTRVMAIGVFIRDRDMGSLVAEMKEKVNREIQLPSGYYITWGGEFENQERAMKRLALIVPVSVLLIFALLFNVFGSAKSALLILLNVPFALIGGVFALLFTGINLSVSAAIGFIALFGQAVLNGVVMVSCFNQLRDEGETSYHAVLKGSLVRLRTVLMTALLAMLGLLPMALSHGIGSETQKPLAVVIIGGLISATLLTLFVLPALYLVFNRDDRPATTAVGQGGSRSTLDRFAIACCLRSTAVAALDELSVLTKLRRRKMRLTHSLLSFVVFICLMTAPPACGQSLPADETAREAAVSAGTQPTQRPKLSPGAEEIARTIGVVPLIERFYDLPERERGVGGGAMSMEALSLRQQITESVVSAGLEVDGLITEIDSELAQISVARAQLEDRRDRALAIGNLATIVAGGATGVLGTALQFSDGTSKAGNIVGVAGGAVSTLLSLIGLRQQRGGKLPLGVAPNMLAKLFDRPTEFHSDYPKEVWTYLNSAPPAEPGDGTRRERLIKQWTDTGRLEPGDTRKAQHKIELMTSSASDQRQLTIDLLNDRAAMLADLRARVALMKRDLSKLMLALRS